MPNRYNALLRNCAALLVTLSGSGHIAALWLRDLTPAALVDALLGAVYLIIGIGLFGQSRFTLFMAILVPACASWLVFDAGLQLEPVYRVRLAANGLVALCSVLALWQVRNVPTP